MPEWLSHLKHLLFTPEGLKELINSGGYVVLFGIIFAETGLLIGFCLPGDSLLFVAGLVARVGQINFFLLNLLLISAAIIGDTVGYWIGYRAGRALFDRKETFFFRKKHLIATQEFYEKHGGKTIILARFVPIIRTFAPVVAGIGKMNYSTFLFFNIFGGIGWVISMTTLGYFLGQFDVVQKNLEKAVILIIFISILPGIYHFAKAKWFSKPTPEPPAA